VFQQNQTLVREKQHLKELANLYAQFVKLISPDLRRPFATITQQIQQLQEELTKSDSKQLISELGQRVEALKTPIDNLITMSGRIQIRDEFDFKPIHLDDVSQAAIRHLKAMAEARRVRVEFNSDPHVPTIYGDEQQMQEAIQYLLHNAIKFNKIGGLVRLDLGISGSDLRLRVVDTGVGIPEDRLATIWDGFTNLSHNGSSRGGGLGLALTRFIVAAHGGHIEAESKYGSGSVFTIYLPLVYEER
jgi:signal transduction histidine kinase